MGVLFLASADVRSRSLWEMVAECRLHIEGETGDLVLTCRGDGLRRPLLAMETLGRLVPASGGEGDAAKPQPAEAPAPAAADRA